MKLEEIRHQIDGLDEQIACLIGRRFKLAHQIGQLKKEMGIGIEDPQREGQIITRLSAMAAREEIPTEELAAVFRHIISASKNLQGLTVGFQGEFGAFSEIAARTHFGPNVATYPFPSLAEVFDATRQGDVTCGIVPVENSLEGSIDATYDLLLDSPLTVSGEVELSISHCLIANRESSLSSIKKIYSHPQALGQCQAFIHHLDCELVPCYDTAGSVKMIRDQQILDGAAIASARAAEIYQMEILARDIQDNPENFTRFFVLSRTPAAETSNDKTSVIFGVKHKPGTLAGVLKAFADAGINLTKLESRPTRRKPWEYNFYMDFEGHYMSPGPERALKQAEQFTLFIKVLGSYARGDRRNC